MHDPKALNVWAGEAKNQKREEAGQLRSSAEGHSCLKSEDAWI